MADRRHYLFLDGLRGLAAGVVLVFHVGQNNFANPLPYAALAVDFFFLLSGFVIAHAYEARLLGGMPIRRFLLLRMIRLYPMILLGTLAGLAITAARVALVGDVSVAQFGSVTVTSLLVLPSYALPQYSTAFPANMAMWSLFFELIANLAYVLLVRRLSDGWLAALVLLAFAGLAAVGFATGTIQHGQDKALLWVGLLRVVFGFALGILIQRRTRVQGIGSAGLPYATGAAFCLLMLVPGRSSAIGDLVAVGICFPAILLVAREVRLTGTRARLAAMLGALSYPLYAIHPPILRACSQLRDRLPGLQAHLPALAAGEILLSLGAGWLALRFFDEPVRRWLGGRLHGTGVTVPADDLGRHPGDLAGGRSAAFGDRLADRPLRADPHGGGRAGGRSGARFARPGDACGGAAGGACGGAMTPATRLAGLLPLVAIILVAIVGVAMAAPPLRERIGVHGSWGAFRDRRPPRCFAIAEPARRGAADGAAPFASVGFWPAAGVRGQLHIRLRRAKLLDAPVMLAIGERRFRLVGGNADAWAPDWRVDAAVIAAMRAGTSLSVETQGRDGRAFADVYALRGGRHRHRCGDACLPLSRTAVANPCRLAYVPPAMTALMPSPGHIDPVPVPRAAVTRRRRTDRPRRADAGAVARAAGGGGAGAEAGEAARQAALALDLQSRRDRVRADDRHRQGDAPVAGGALRRRPPRGGDCAGLHRRDAQMAAPLGRRAGL